MCETTIGALFDLDGVLIDSESEYTRVWSEVNRRFPTPYPDLAHRIKGMTLDNIVATYYEADGLGDKVRETLHMLEDEMKYEWLPGAKSFVEWLIENGIPRALVTSSDNKKMDHLREEVPELENMMTELVTADKITRSKPDPEGYLLGAELIGADPRHCVVFEDSLQGVKAGRASGAYVIGIAGTLPASAIEPYCDKVVNNLEEVDKTSLINILINR